MHAAGIHPAQVNATSNPWITTALSFYRTRTNMGAMSIFKNKYKMH
jgi:hypothetical protein